MATSEWHSSLANVENRLRRSLGLSGPVDLALKPELTPVIVSDDSTRPGASSQLRGRFWMASVPIGIGVGQRGSAWLFCDAPYANSGQVDFQQGGIIVDRITVGFRSVGGANTLRLTMYAFPTDLVLAPGIPIAVTPNNARFCDPTRSGSEVAPVALYGSGVTPPETGGGPQIYRWDLHGPVAGGVVAGTLQEELKIFLNWNSALVVGIDPTTVPGFAEELAVSYQGRIF